MVAVLARLQLTLMLRGLRASPGRAIALVLGGVLGLLAVVGIAAGFVAVSSASPVDVQTYSVLTLGFVVVLWMVLPLLLFGVDATLDPVRFALLPLTVRQLRPGLLVAGLVGVPGVLTMLLAVTPLLGWAGTEVGALLAALAMAPIFTLTCFVSSRALTAWFATALASRRFQDLAAVILGTFIISIGLISNALSSKATNEPDQLGSIVKQSGSALSWTPFGWTAAVPGDVAQGQWGVAAARAIAALGWVIVLWVVWGRALHRAMTSASEAGGAVVGEASSLVDRLYPASQVGAVAARCLRYWRRDPRYLVSLVGIAVVPIMFASTSMLGGGDSTVLFLMPVFVAAMVGPSHVADLAYDHSALWTHVASGVSGRADRLGRVLALGTVVAPLMLLAWVVATVMSGRLDLALASLGATLTLLLCGLGVGSFAGSLHPGQAPPPGTNPFGTGGGGSGVLTMGLFFAGGIAALLVAAPILVPLVLWGLNSVALQALLLLIGTAWGLLVLRLAVDNAGRRLDATWPELLSKVSGEKH